MKRIVLLLLVSSTLCGQHFANITGKRDYSYNNIDALKNDSKSIPGLTLAIHTLKHPIDSTLDFTYKKIGERDLLMDYYGLMQKSNRPALLFIHGGGWRSGDKSQHRELAKSLADKGFRVFLMEYRLSTEALYPAAMIDAHDGLKYLFENAKKFKIDTKRISVAGFSAGGQMAALLGSTWDEDLYGRHSNTYKIHSVIDLDGILAFIHPESGEGDDSKKLSAATLYFGMNKEQGATRWHEASALNHVSKNDPPVMFINSSVERMHAGREDFIQKMKSFNISTKVHTFSTSPHSFLLYTPWMEQVAELIAGVLN